MRVLIAGGGTGGHIFMGVALARELVRRDPATELLFVGGRRGLDARIIPQQGFKLELIDVEGLKGMSWKRLLMSLKLLPKSLWQSWRLIGRFRPDLAIGLGGYSSGPVLLAAALRGVPALIVEPNAVPGFTNRLLARFVDEAAVAFAEARQYLGGKGVETGVPVRPEFFSTARREPGEKFSLLAYGGSQGSHSINMALCGALPLLKPHRDRLAITHQTGEADFELVARAYRSAGFTADVRPFIDNMAEALAQADLVISRAGAATIAELTAAGKAAILVPFPGATDQHQRRNAQTLAARGAAIVIDQSKLSGARLAREILALMDDRERLAKMQEASARLARPNAAARIIDLALRLAGGRAQRADRRGFSVR